MSDPNIPRDPRQLARDILAGKVSIEELAREQARRRTQKVGGPAALPQQSRATAPSDRTGPARVPAPVIAKQPIPARASGLPPMPTAQPMPQRGPVINRIPSQKPPVRVLAPRVTTLPPPMPAQASKPLGGKPEALPAVTGSPSVRVTSRTIAQALKNRNICRRAMIMSEILQPPLALR